MIQYDLTTCTEITSHSNRQHRSILDDIFEDIRVDKEIDDIVAERQFMRNLDPEHLSDDDKIIWNL